MIEPLFLQIYRQVVREHSLERMHENVAAIYLEQEQRRQERRLAKILMSISVLLLICHLPRVIRLIYEGFFYDFIFEQTCITKGYWLNWTLYYIRSIDDSNKIQIKWVFF